MIRAPAMAASAEQQLLDLEQCAGVDQRRLALARTLLQRAASERPRVSLYLQAQAAQVLAACAADAQQLQQRAQAALSLLRAQFPAALAQAQQLQQQGDLHTLVQLPERLQRAAASVHTCAQLRQLSQCLMSAEVAPVGAPSGLALDELLQRQEREILEQERLKQEHLKQEDLQRETLRQEDLQQEDLQQELLQQKTLQVLSPAPALPAAVLPDRAGESGQSLALNPLATPGPLLALNPAPALRPDPDVKLQPHLQAARVLRQARAEQHTDFRLDTAIRTGPESPGPLNPQMLTIRALTNLRDLSPQYLSRFMAYAETLLWLDQADNLPDPVKPGKAAKAGAKKPAKSRGRTGAGAGPRSGT